MRSIKPFLLQDGLGGQAFDSAYKQVQLARGFEAGSVPVNLRQPVRRVADIPVKLQIFP